MSESHSDPSPVVSDDRVPHEILELISAGYWEWQLPDQTEWLSPAFVRMFGYEGLDLPSLNGVRTWQALIFPEDRALLLEGLEQHIQSGGKTPLEIEMRCRHQDGSTLWVLCRCKVTTWSESHAPTRMVGCLMNISSLKEQDIALRRSEARLQFAIEESGDGLWDYDFRTKQIFLSPRFKATLGFAEEEIGNRLEDWEALVHPDDLPRVRHSFYQHTENKTPIYRNEHRLRCKDGTYKWILDRGKIIESATDGTPLRVVGTQTDITSQRKMEQRLRESEERRQAVLNAATGVALVATDHQGMITFFSRGAEQLLGYTSAEITGHHTPAIFHDPAEIAARGYRLTAELGEPIEGFRVITAIPDRDGSERREWTYLCKDGTRKSVDLTVTVSKNSDGHTSYLGTAVDITERIRMDSALRVSEQKFRSIFELLPVGMAMNDLETGRFTYANQSLLDSLGYTQEVLESLSYSEITPDEYQPLDHHQLSILKKSGRYGPYEKELIRPGGERISILLHGMLLPGNDDQPVICSIFQDISDIKRIERELRKAIDAQQAALALLESAGRIARVGHWEYLLGAFGPTWSDITCEIHDLPPGTRVSLDDAIGFYEEESKAEIAAAVQYTLDSGKSFEFEALLRTAKGRERWVHSRGEPIWNDSGEIIGLRGVVQDVDDRRRAATLLEQRNRELEAATERAEANARAKAEFLANMSHEIRTPLNAVIGMSEMLTTTKLNPRDRELVDTIHKSADVLLGLINDILDFSKIESGQLDLECISFNTRECLESAMDVLAHAAAKKHLDLIYWIDPSVPSFILGDLTRLRQVLVNLIGNAIKFTVEGQVYIHVTCKQHSDTGWQLHVSVQDSGIGIPEDRKNKLFQAFSQVDASTTRRYGGTGLGLAISHRLIQKMNGQIWVESEVGVGSNFQFEIPIQLADEPSPGNSEMLSTKMLAGLQVLIVDDNATHRWILKKQSELWSMLPTVAESPAQVIALAQHSATFDIVIIDGDMPGLDSLDWVSSIRSPRPEHQVTVVLLTSLEREEKKTPTPGISAVVTKPIKYLSLYHAILDAIGVGQERHVLNEHAKLGDAYQLKILVAEDNPVNQRVIDLILRRLGFSVTIVNNGLEALKALEAQAFDVAFMDVQMPEMDGLAASREICRRYDSTERPWLIALTAHALDADKKDCYDAGMDDYLSKPVRTEALKLALQRAVAHRDTNRSTKNNS